MGSQSNNSKRLSGSCIVGAVVLLVAVLLIVLGALVWLLLTGSDALTPLTVVFALLTVLIELGAIAYSIASLRIAGKTIFYESGNPVQMAKSLYESGFLQAQTLLAILVVGVVCCLMSSKLVQPSEGLPILTFATGFALARQSKRFESATRSD